tara:strand:+ start:113 stop:346 length:234 start_codon:yes stop_codon:yes gene_type:complete
MAYNFFNNNNVRWGNVITGSLYSDNWNDFLSYISSSGETLSESELQVYQNWLTDCENSSTGSLWFEVMLAENGGSFK